MTSRTTTVLGLNSSDFQVLTTIQTDVENPWKNESDAQQIVEVTYLAIIIVLGTVGNLIVIFSIALERRIHAHGNIFVINLAVADLLVTGFVVPTVLDNVLHRGNALSEATCQAAGYIVTVTCTCSLCNLTLIAVNRFWAVVYSTTYVEKFSKKRVHWMVSGTWIWSNLVTIPILIGWGRIAYDAKMQLCSFDDTYSTSYTNFLTSCAILIPLIIIFFCYTKIFLKVRSSGRWVQSLSVASRSQQNSSQKRRKERKERNLLQTLATTVAFFCICWLPYGFTIIIDPKHVPAQAKKIFGWLGLSNSAVNFIIYGTMNPVFRRGYRNLFYFLLRCKWIRRKSSARIQHGSNSDSFYRSMRRKSNPTNNTPGSQSSAKKNLYFLKPSSQKAFINLKNNSDSLYCSGGTPQMLEKFLSKSVQEECSKELHSSFVDDTHDKASSLQHTTTSLSATSSNPSNFLKKKKSKLIEEKRAKVEARTKTNSLMLLQIEMIDDDTDICEPRRTRSEIPVGVSRPLKRRTASDVEENAAQRQHSSTIN